MTTKIHYLQHVPYEGLGSLEGEFRRRGWTVTSTHWYRGDPSPSLQQFDWLVIMGGPMNVDDHENYPWLTEEKALIRAAIEEGKTVLGICLGAQLIARALNTQVDLMPTREIGWHPVRREAGARASILDAALPERFDAFHWHGDTFQLPNGAQRLASSQACHNQAFSYGDRVLGLQCHLEMTPELAQTLIDNSQSELDDSPFVQSAGQMMRDPEHFGESNRLLSRMLDTLPH